MKYTDKNTDDRARRPRRSKADIEAAIQKAAVAQIRKKGFVRALVTDIVKKAKIEPIVFYNRFKNLEEFYDQFVKRYDYWVSDLSHQLRPDLSNVEGYSSSLQELLKALLNDHMIVELLRWEIAEGTSTTERTAKLREIDFNQITELLQHEFEDKENTDAVAISSLIVAGLYFMVLHKDRSTFGGIDINTPEGRQRISNAFAQLGEMLYNSTLTDSRKQKLTECLRQEGLSAEAIGRCIKQLD